MRRSTIAALASAGALALTTIALAPSAGAAPSPTGQANRNVHVCADATAGSAACDAIRHDKVDGNGRVQPNAAAPTGYGPDAIQSAYNLAGLKSGGRTVAIVDAYDDPNAEQDLLTYRSYYNLPTIKFTKVNQNGQPSPLPRANGGWAQEISLDLDMVSATCPDCNILLVEANSATNANLNAAVATAAGAQGVIAISNSYGGSDGSAANYQAYWNAAQAGKAVTASTGDSGYGAQSPATYPGVVAVGGTSLNRASNSRGWTESVWSGAGSGCSTVSSNTKPSYQTSATQCANKADADVSAVADPNTGVAVYDSYAYQGARGWLQFGGTSASSPIIASVFALSGNTKGAITGLAGELPWTATTGLNDVTSGSNGTCSTAVWCNAKTGWDGPTGVGTPYGTAAF